MKYNTVIQENRTKRRVGVSCMMVGKLIRLDKMMFWASIDNIILKRRHAYGR